MKKILLFFLGLITFSYAVSEIKVICDRDGESVYLDGKYKSDCDSGEPVAILTNAGKHTVIVKKDNKNGSYYYFKKNFKIGDGIQKVIEPNTNIYYTESYYYLKAKKSNNIDDYWTYLEKYPNGKYSDKIKKYLDNYYWKNCKNIEECEKYLSKIKWGMHRDEAKTKLEKLYYKQCDSIYKCKLYLKKYPHGKYSKIVKQKIEKLFFKNCSCNYLDGCNYYLKLYPHGKYKNNIQNIIKNCSNQCNDIQSCEEFFSKFPDKAYLVKDKLEKMYFLKAQKDEKYADKYLEKYPNGKYKDKVKEIKLYFVALRTKNPNLYKKFLTIYKNKTDKYVEKIKFYYYHTYNYLDFKEKLINLIGGK